MEVVQGLDATVSLLGAAWRLVNVILEARREVRNASEKTNKLLDTVLKAQCSLRHLVDLPEGQPLSDGLDGPLKALGEELCLALEKVQRNVKSNERRQAGNQLVAIARSVSGRGARQQNKETLSIIQRLEAVLAIIDREVLYFLGGEAANGRRTQVPGSSVHALVTKALSLALASEVDETLFLAVVVSHGNSWIDPLNSKKQEPVKMPVQIRLNGHKRDAREGGYEVPNHTKVRFSMSVSFGQWYFYVLTYDRWASAEPRVVFPKSAKNTINGVSSDSREPRVFPNRDTYRGDLISLKVERSEGVPDDEEGQVSIFLILTSTQLQKDVALEPRFTIQDIERHMNSVGEDELIVKHIPFDIAK